jgi:Mg-chelatase subunit ChlD
LSLGIVTQTAIIGINDGENTALLAAQRKQLQIGVKRNNYLVMFTIDGSGSMSGNRWSNVRRAINMFIENLSEDDMISTIIFNDKA